MTERVSREYHEARGATHAQEGRRFDRRICMNVDRETEELKSAPDERTTIVTSAWVSVVLNRGCVKMADLIIRVAGERAERLQDLAGRQGMLPQEWVERVIDQSAEAAIRESVEPSASLLVELARIADAVPEEELGPLREDGSEQHDHYIYGVPKRPR